MAFTKFANFEDAQVLDVKGSPTRLHTASLGKLSDYENYRTGDGYMYVRIRAISSRVNKNHDGWPSVELAGSKDIFDKHSKQSSSGFTVEASEGDPEFGFATFLGKPNFVDHNNSDPSRARGVVVDAKLRVLPKEASLDHYYSSGEADPEHLPPTEVELLLEIDAKSFPKYAKAIRSGDLDGFSMGCDVEKSKCSHCGHVATNPSEYCSHIMAKGAHHDFKTAEGKRISRKSYENCYGIKFFEISGVFDPADETALAREVRAGVIKEGMPNAEGEPWPWEVEHEPQVDPETGQESVELPPHYPNLLNYLNSAEGTPEIQSYKKQVEDYLDHLGYPHREEAMFNAPTVEHPLGREGSVKKIAENPLPQSFHTKAPEEVDTERQEHICPICGENMEGETCDVCGYVEPPQGLGTPELDKAQELSHEMQQHDEQMLQPQPQAPPPGGPPGGAPGGPPGGPMGGGPPMAGGPLKPPMGPRNRIPTASVMSEMRWAPRIDSKLAGRINQFEQPLQATKKPATNDPKNQTVIKNPATPVTAAMRTAQELIRAANQGDTMSTRTADGPTGPDAAPDTRTDVTGVGGVIEPSNEQASKADAQTDVTGIGSTGVTDVESEKTESLPTASEGGDDSGFNTDKTTDDSGPTSTYGDSDGTEKAFTDGVTQESLEGNQNKDSAAHVAYDAKPFYDQEGLSGGSANKGTEPIDAVGKASERVDVLSPATTPDSCTSGPTSTWTGTDGNKIYRQQDPVTNESMALGGGGEGTGSANWTSHVVAAIKLADMEVELDLLPKDEKYNRLAELQQIDSQKLEAQLNTLSRVKTAGLAKLAKARQAGVTKMPGAFGRRTAAPNPDWRESGRSFERVTDAEHIASSGEIPEDVLDASLFS